MNKYGHGNVAACWFSVGAPVEATVFERERLRCNACQQVFTVGEPETAGPAKYAETAVAIIALMKAHGPRNLMNPAWPKGSSSASRIRQPEAPEAGALANSQEGSGFRPETGPPGDNSSHDATDVPPSRPSPVDAHPLLTPKTSTSIRRNQLRYTAARHTGESPSLVLSAPRDSWPGCSGHRRLRREP
jgi:hypothetical protein